MLQDYALEVLHSCSCNYCLSIDNTFTQKDATFKIKILRQILHHGNITSLGDQYAYKDMSLDFTAFS